MIQYSTQPQPQPKIAQKGQISWGTTFHNCVKLVVTAAAFGVSVAVLLGTVVYGVAMALRFAGVIA